MQSNQDLHSSSRGSLKDVDDWHKVKVQIWLLICTGHPEDLLFIYKNSVVVSDLPVPDSIINNWNTKIHVKTDKKSLDHDM